MYTKLKEYITNEWKEIGQVEFSESKDVLGQTPWIYVHTWSMGCIKEEETYYVYYVKDKKNSIEKLPLDTSPLGKQVSVFSHEYEGETISESLNRIKSILPKEFFLVRHKLKQEKLEKRQFSNEENQLHAFWIQKKDIKNNN